MLGRGAHFDGGETTVGTDWTTVAEVVMGGLCSALAFSVVNSGDTATSGFRARIKMHADDDWQEYLSGTDFDASEALKWGSTEGPHELSAGGVATVSVAASAFHAVQLQAKVASDTTTLRARGTVGGA